ncbi:MAG: UvrD-helicase domain-containing protein [Pseudomonadota bacterium]
MTVMQQNDQAARLAAVDPRQSVIVQAPAGSGKTTLLVERYLGLLAVVDQPEEILAITFTRKAAAEMKQRVLRYLDPAFETTQTHELSALNKAHAAEQNVRDWGLRENPQRMQIRTIDSFNQYLARTMPVASRLGPVPSPSDNAGRLYRQAARTVLAEIDKTSGQDHSLADDVSRLLSWRNQDQRGVEDLLVGLLTKREQWLRVVGPSGTPERDDLQGLMVELIEQQLGHSYRALTEALARIYSSAHELAHLASSAARTLRENDKAGPALACEGLQTLPGKQCNNLPVWRGLIDLLLLKKDRRFRKSLDIRSGFVAQSPEKDRMLELLASLADDQQLAESLHRTRQLPKPRYDDDDWRTLQALIRVMQRAALELQLVFAEYGQSDFAALAEAALRGLGQGSGDVTDLGLYLDQRIQHLLVDEFQDTNYSQFRLLEALTQGWQADDGRSLFLVGDPMQSIYRFREAEVGLFMRARTFGLNDITLTPLHLSANYRSQAQIVDWVNQAIGPIFPDREDIVSGSVAYVPSMATRGDHGQVQVMALPDRISEAQALAEMLRLELPERQKDNAFRAAIIVRSRSHLAEILPALRAAGLRYRAVKLDPLIARPVVQDLLAITQAIMNPADRTAVLALLRSPMAGLTLDDLDRLAGLNAVDTGDQATAHAAAHPFSRQALQQLSEDGRSRATRVFDVLQQARTLWQRRSVRDLVEGAWHALHGPNCLQQPSSDLEDAADYLDFIENAEREGWLEDPHIVDERLKTEQSGSHPPNDGEDANVLEVLTMHSAKGLEWDWVIVPGLDRKPRSRTNELLNWLPFTNAKGQERVLLAPLKASDQHENSAMVEFIRSEQARRDRFENQRLLYVAATRARQRLTLCACLDSEKKIPGPAAGSLLAELWPQIGQAFIEQLSTCTHARANSASMPDQSLRRIAGPHHSHAQALNWQPLLPMREHETEIEFNWAGMQARRIGSVLHRLLERVGQIGIERFDPGRRERLIARIPHLLTALGTANSELPEAVLLVQQSLIDTLSDPTGQWLLSNQHDDAGCELALSGQLDGQLVNAIVDRTFIDDGCRWIIDYKSGHHAGADLDGFFAIEAERYREQLGRYVRLFEQMGETNIRAALYFPRHQKLMIVET